MDLETEILNLVRMTDASLTMPSDWEIERYLRMTHGWKTNFPTERHPVIMSAIATALAQWNKLYGKGTAKSAVTTTTAKSAARVGSLSAWEARVREMKWAEVEAFCRKNKIEFKREGGNPGILSMRAKNAVYAALRHGLKPKD